MGEFIGWVRYILAQYWRLFQRGETAMAMERLENLSDEVTEGRRVMLEGKRNGLNEVIGS